MSLPEGWFPDPSQPEREMRWDGQRWTGETRRVAGVEPVEGADSESAPPSATSQLFPARPWRNRRRLFVAGSVIALLIGVGVTAAVVAEHNHQLAVAATKAAEEKKAAANRAQAVASAKAAADDAKRAARKESVTAIESSVQKMAEDDVAKGLLDGPVSRVTCDPVSGSYEVLTDQTTTFNCFAATKDNGDGTYSGYYFNATINWDSGSYTYGLGRAN